MIEATHADEYKVIQDAMSDTFDSCEKYLADSMVELVKLRKKIADGELVEVKHGRWIDREPNVQNSSYRKSGMSFYCSNCLHPAGKFKHTTYKYCPWCGVKMDEETVT